MKSHYTRAFGAVAVGLGLFSGCVSDFSFSSNQNVAANPNLPNSSGSATTPGSSPPPSTPSCQTVLQNTLENLRFLFMVDNSGSTAQTDPNDTYRVDTIQEFLNQYGTKLNFSYNFGMFASTAKLYDTVQQKFEANAMSPFGSATDLANALQIFEGIPPDGDTAYAAAFQAMQAAIVNDENANGSKWNYVIVFMSDGMPTDIPKPIDANIIKMVDNLRSAVSANGNLLTISAVYFGPEDPGSIDHLQTMANEGLGQFIDTNQLNGNDFSIDDLISVPGQVCTSN